MSAVPRSGAIHGSPVPFGLGHSLTASLGRWTMFCAGTGNTRASSLLSGALPSGAATSSAGVRSSSLATLTSCWSWRHEPTCRGGCPCLELRRAGLGWLANEGQGFEPRRLLIGDGGSCSCARDGARMTPEAAPRTAAGRALVAEPYFHDPHCWVVSPKRKDEPCDCGLVDRILAIEAEAMAVADATPEFARLAAAGTALDVERLAEALHGFLQARPDNWPHTARPRVQPHPCWPCWNGADYVAAEYARLAGEEGT